MVKGKPGQFRVGISRPLPYNSPMDNLQTSLYQTHLDFGARLVPFGGWDMPVQYSGIINEVKAVRTAAIRSFIDAADVSDNISLSAESLRACNDISAKVKTLSLFVDPPFVQLAEYASSYGDDYGRFVDNIELAKQQLVYIPPCDDDDPGVRRRSCGNGPCT